ncbi:GNAT family N-acetyltransferase, partial [Streptomyces sp. NEAU-H3]|uniref:GNAT family N-acetyltransferase n=1 Tax=Streptomyces sp. NEAU-H3 TaxID=2720636 RepID=UPI00143CC00C
LAAALRRAARTALVDLRELRPGAATELLLAHWRGLAVRRPDSPCLELPARPLAELLTRLPASRARPRHRGDARPRRGRFRDHLVRSVTTMVRTGDAQLTAYRLAGETVAVDLTLLSQRLAGGYLYGADPALRERNADGATMLLRTASALAAEDGRETLSLLRGTEPYKSHWRPDTVVNQRLLLSTRRTAPLLWLRTAHATARTQAATWLHAHRAKPPTRD